MSKSTEQAMRAVKAIEQARWMAIMTTNKAGLLAPREAAAIIDRETGLPEMVAALEQIRERTSTGGETLTYGQVVDVHLIAVGALTHGRADP